MPRQQTSLSPDLVAQWVQQKDRIDALQFGLLSPDTICRMSVAEIRSTQIYDQTTFLPNFHAINDPRMGVTDRESRCYTCRAGMDVCPGHFGHISLNSPVYHAGMLLFLVKIMKLVCFNCSKLLICRTADDLMAGSDQQPAEGLASIEEVEERQRLLKIKNKKLRFKRAQLLAESVNFCDAQKGGCGYRQPKMRKVGLKIEIEYLDDNFDNTRDRKDTLWPDQALKVLERISDDDCKLIGLDPENGRPDWAVLRNIAVAPPPVRPSVVMTSTMRSEDDLTYAYQQIVKMNIVLKEQKEKGANQTIINELRQALQYFVATLMDNKIAGQPVQKHKSGKAIKCIRSRLKGKEGRLRGNLMGKRVDFSSRTVITPDPNLALDELGVPLEVAKNMTYPETVTIQNIDVMRALVMNGPSVWPGAKYIIRHDEKIIDLSMLRCRSDVHLEIGYKVERHLKDGDYVIFNRQPSLHKMSIMGHRVKVLPYSTFRLNLSVTTPYNADFDGDEMNMHVAQSYESLAEIREIMSVPKQIISPQSNRPCMGIVQDSLLGSMLMTSRDTFITRDEAMQLCMWVSEFGMTGEVKTLPTPAVIKPQPLWTGKQIFSLLIPNLNLSRNKNRDQPFSCLKDSNVLIDGGELLQGLLTKAIIGPTGQGLCHIITRDYSHARAAEFLSSVQTLVNNWLVTTGFTVGVQDIIVNEKKTAESIHATLQKYKKSVSSIVSKSQMGKLKSQPGKTMQESFEAQVNKKLNDARDKSGNIALDGLSAENRLRNMVNAGSKGSNINISQIMACVGQQNVEGKRIPFGFHHRTLPHFSKDDFGPESKGFVESSYLSGLSPSELYFHAMGGREGLIDTAVKTAETGYISRRLIKALEDVMVQYDGSVRSSRFDMVQFVYGEDGISGENIEDQQLELLKMADKDLDRTCKFPARGQSEESDKNLFSSVTETVFTDLDLDKSQKQAIEQEYKRILADRSCLRNEIFKISPDDQIHMPVNIARLLSQTKSQFGIKVNSKSDLRPETVTRRLNQMLEELSVLPGSKTLGNRFLSEADLNARQLFNIYMRFNLCANKVIMQEKLSTPSFEWLLGEVKSRFETSLVNPGEMVGSIAAQSMGEPATQMTLNTFHFAGISAKNVTLGVPRFKEIINVSNNIKTPSLKIFLQESSKHNQDKVAKLGMLIEYTTLSHVVSQSGIYYDPDPERTVVKEDAALVQLYNDVPVLEDQSRDSQSPWLLRLQLDKDKMVHKGLQMAMIDKKLSEVFPEQISLMVSDENSDSHVVRIRINSIEDDTSETVASYLKNEFEPMILNHLTLKGLPEITKVTYTKHQEHDYCPKTGKLKFTDDNWVIETDGTALSKIMTLNKVDATKTVSNDNLEVLSVLGCEAARQSLINELRFVFGSYGIYVNYRHISTLVDIMAQKGKLTSITRHGINRVDTSGPLRKCSFEETVEILLEGAMFSEVDWLSGISENVIMGQLGPFGSGCFGLQLDADVVEKHAIKVSGLDGIFERDSWECDTPNTQVSKGAEMMMTPLMDTGTPSQDVDMAASNYSAMMTPGGYKSEIGFSPAPAHFDQFTSPHYQSPSPYYGSPAMAGARPGSGQYASPIYSQVMGLNSGSAAGLPNSPMYNASLANQGLKQSGSYGSPIYKQDPVGNYSPAYGVVQQQMNSAAKQSMVSPMYSPSAACIQSPAYTSQQNRSAFKQSNYSPAYTPQNLQSPSYTGLSGVSDAKSNALINGLPIQSPVYVPLATQHNSAEDANKLATSPQYLQSHAEVIQSPAYNPASPQYNGVASSRSHRKSKTQLQVSQPIKEEHNEGDTD